MLSDALIEELAAQLEEAEQSRQQLRHFSQSHPGMTIEDGYRINRAWMKIKAAQGHTVIGHKIGLTSRAMQISSNIDEPDYGTLLDTMRYTCKAGEVLEIPVDIFHGLLGYRICLKNAAAAPLKNVTSLQNLMKIKIGQSEEWPDVNIYRANHIKPVLTPGLSSLFEMLGYKRFDCLPLGANEVVHIYEEKKQQYPFLAIDDQLLIYYKFPIYFYVSKTHPKVAKRLELGLKKLEANGDFDAIFRKHHEHDLKILNLRNRHLVCLESPFIDERDQCKKPIGYPDEWID